MFSRRAGWTGSWLRVGCRSACWQVTCDRSLGSRKQHYEKDIGSQGSCSGRADLLYRSRSGGRGEEDSSPGPRFSQND